MVFVQLNKKFTDMIMEPEGAPPSSSQMLL